MRVGVEVGPVTVSESVKRPGCAGCLVNAAMLALVGGSVALIVFGATNNHGAGHNWAAMALGILLCLAALALLVGVNVALRRQRR